jgi:alpha-galactosidase/6-phospho-beta-glucosidase family protein
MNQPNQGQILNLSQDVVVETFAMTNAAGANPTSLSLLPVGILSVVQQHGGNQEMIEEAAISGKRDLAMKVMINDPMVTNIEKYE